MKVSGRDKPGRVLLAPSLVLLVLLACFSIGAFLIFSQRSMNSLFERVEKQYHQDLVNIVTVARNAVEPVLTDLRIGEIGREEAIRRIRALVRTMTYRDEYGDNYVFMSSFGGEMLVQPFEPMKESTNQWDLQDANGVYIIRELADAVRKYPNGSFVQYHYNLPGVYDFQTKLTYVVGLPEIECYIGTGMYMAKAIQEQKEILTYIKFASIWLLLAVLGPLSISIFVILKRNRRLSEEVRTRMQAEEDMKKGEEKYRS
ncbi:MAG: cache domain-containing protein, partial [Desulfobacteraceae bacterium]|nr:cache domain-containing protein [Desulfobacteraceae bacterium]